jgi:putative aminopeptidase FrvX
LLAVPTKTWREERLIKWLIAYFKTKGWEWYEDKSHNLYVTKGTLVNGERYPCVAAHTDSVHEHEKVTIEEDGDRLIAISELGDQTGLGGDDKSGVYICLELLERLPVLKAAFFVCEEIGCVGSRACDPTFFHNVGYLMEFDSPCDDILTYTCDGTQLFPDSGRFHDILLPIVKAHGVTNWQHHPYTDVSVLKRKFGFPCLNLPAGYFRMHSTSEYVVVSAVSNGIKLGLNLIQAFGLEQYRYEAPERYTTSRPALPVTGLMCHG